MKRIVYTIAVGNRKHAECALGLGRSLRLIGDTTKRVLVTDKPDAYGWKRCFDEVVEAHDPLPWVFYTKLSALERTDADQVLFIDGDTLAFKRLDPIFEACKGTKFAVQGQPITSGFWYGSVEEHLRRHGVSSLPQFNGGMIYYERAPETVAFFAQVRDLMERAQELGFWDGTGLIPDEPCISLAMQQSGFGTLLADQTDFQNSATGLIGKLRLDVAKGECSFLTRRYDVRYVEPILFHASRYVNYLIYWKQLATLEKLDRYEQTRPYGYLPPVAKLRRSIERRLLKYVYRKL